MTTKKRTWLLPVGWGFFLWLIFLLFQARGIFGGDSGDLVTAAYLGGIPHPPGYPLYTFLGWLTSRLPLETVAWRVGILSSLPHAGAATIVTLFVWHLTGGLAYGIFASLVLVGNYLFFLYSTTPEVFALLDFFLIVLLYVVYRWRQTKKEQYLYWFAFLLGLSFTHHHMILFFVPTLGYWILSHAKLKTRVLIRCLGFMVLGLAPYLYLPLAARGTSIINWDRPVDLVNTIRLITRADYGTFVSSGFYGTTTTERLIGIRTYLGLVFFDIPWSVLVLALLGSYWLWKKDRSFFLGYLLGLVMMGPLFFFYASFPLVNRFTLGTFERFLLPTYMLLAPLAAMGLVKLRERFGRFWWKNAGIAVFFLLPLSTLGMTLWRFWGLARDRTAEHLARDVLASVPDGGILLLQRDTPLFTSQYVRYVLGVREDVKLLHSTRMNTVDYPSVVRLVYPQITLPAVRGDTFLTEFIQINSAKFPIAAINRLPAPAGWLWVPRGLVFVLTHESKLASIDDMARQNYALWNSYHNVGEGILSRYNHLMLSDTRDVYATARIELGKTLMRGGKLADAKSQFEEALSLGGDTQASDSFTYLGLSELFLGECESALTAFANARRVSPSPDPNLFLYEAQTHRDCLGDSERADDLFAQYEKQRKSQETPLGQPK